MSVISGGIFSKPRGKTGGIVFGAARTRQGKLATARELVKPSNPNTAAQQTQRSKFKSALDAVKRIGSSIYRTDWNRSVGQLPGFQSMLSVLINQMNAAKELILVQDVNLGSLPKPEDLTAVSEDTTHIKISWTAPTDSAAMSGSKLKALFFARTESERDKPNGVSVSDTALLSDGSVIVEVGSILGNFEVYVYVEGTTTLSGLYSPAFHFTVVMP